MPEYAVSFIEDAPAIGRTSEVEHAEIMDNGWVAVRWRDFGESTMYYPPWVVRNVQTPRPPSLTERIRTAIRNIDDDEPEPEEEPQTPEP